MAADGEQTDLAQLHEQVVNGFAAGWKNPNPHAWDDLLSPDVELRQPLMPDGRGVEHWQNEFAYFLAFLPDLRGRVIDWTGRGNSVHIHVQCTATAGGRPLTFEAVDRLTISPEGKLSSASPTSIRPRCWRLWRYGQGPGAHGCAPVRRRLRRAAG